MDAFEPADPAPRAHREINGYHEIGSIGSGVFGEVLKAKQNKRLVALKLQANNPSIVSNITRECAILSHVQGDRIVRHIDTFFWGGFNVLVMELLAVSLQNLIDARRVTEPEHVFLMIVEGVEHIPRLHVIHRDLKPANIMLDHSNQVKIIDFGLSCVHVNHGSGDFAYSPNLQTSWYRSPEVFFGLPYGYKADMWSVGCIHYELLRGGPLFSSENSLTSDLQILMQQVHLFGGRSVDDYRKLTQGPSGFQTVDVLSDVEERMLQPHPSTRVGSAELLRLLRRETASVKKRKIDDLLD